MALKAGETSLAALLGALSRATDLAMGQPMGHGVRTCLVSLQLAERLRLPKALREEIYWVALLNHAGCTADLHVSQGVFGDEVSSRAWFAGIDHGKFSEVLGALYRNVGKGRSAPMRLLIQARTLAAMPRLMASAKATCEVARGLARTFGLKPAVVEAIEKAYERMDGKGFPNGLRGESVPLSVRLVQVAQVAELARRLEPAGDWAATLAARGGLDASMVAAAGRGAQAEALFAYAESSEWDTLLALAPRDSGEASLAAARIDAVLEGFADMADLMSPYFAGHSRAVARLAGETMVRLGRPEEEQETARRAGLVHDIGRAGITVGLWNKPSRFDDGEKEQMRLHAYQTRRILEGIPGLEAVARAAGSTHERLDGGGYPMGSREPDLIAGAVAGADIMAALLEPRPHRPAFDPGEASRILIAEAGARRMDPAVVRALVEAQGQKAPVPTWPDGLTDREVQVLCVAARGLTNKEIAASLGLAPKTVGNHLQNVFPKIGVTTRAAAALYAMQKDLLRFARKA